MIVFPESLEAASAAAGELRAGGTDLQERRHLGLSRGPLIDLRDLGGLDAITVGTEGARLGARVTVAALAAHAEVRAGWAGLAESAAHLANPHIRAVATLGGNLLQRSRCWYFRNPAWRCFRSGGDQCPARTGDHLFHVCFDLGPCVAPHPSTLGMALLAYDGTVEVQGPEGTRRMTAAALYGDGSDAYHDHQLGAHEVLTHLILPPAVPGERSAYVRASSRQLAEWPLCEALAIVEVRDGTIRRARVAVGGVAPVPLRLGGVERALNGAGAQPSTLAEASALAIEGARPLPMTGYKLTLVAATVLEALEQALARPPSA